MKNINIEKLEVSQLNARQIESDVSELANSIKSVGILEPLIVRQKNGKYEIVIGQRRFLAGKKIGLKEFPCIIREMTDEDAILLSLIENIQKEDLVPMDMARGIKKLKEMSHGVTFEEIADKIGMSRMEIWRYLSYLSITPEIQEKISMEDIETTSKLSQLEPARQIEFFEEVSEKEELPRETKIEIIKEAKRKPEKPIKEIKERIIKESEVFVTIFIKKKNLDILKKIAERQGKEMEVMITEILTEWIQGRSVL